MADLRLDIGTGIKSVDIYDSNGTKLATKFINVGNKEELKKWASEFTKLQDIEGDDAAMLDKIESLERQIIEQTVGDFEMFWKASGENPLVLLKTIKALSTFITSQLEDMYKEFV
jgi:hypothetical protein